MVVESKAKRWGNSLAVVIPARLAEQLRLRAGEAVFFDVKRKENPLKELFGSLSFKRPVRKIVKEIRDDLEGEWLNGKSA